MPLVVSPIDGSPMKQITRFGIEFDVCPTSGGIWLDRGELEKLIDFILNQRDSKQDDSESGDSTGRSGYAPREKSHRDDHSHRDDNHRDDHAYRPHGDKEYGRESGRYPQKKEGKLAQIMGMFDF